MNFVRLNKKISITDYAATTFQTQYGNTVGDRFYGIQYHLPAVGSELEQVWSMIPERYRKDFFLNLMTVNSRIPPHTDSKINITINIYIKTAECTTQFYRVLREAATTKIANQTNGAIFDPRCLEFVDEFFAEPGEVWMLDVTQPHSVISSQSVDRVALCVQTNSYSFDEVVEMLTETGWI
jgi:hypothetical protein